MVVPRYSTAALVTRYVVRHILSFGVFYLILRALGDDLHKRGGWQFVAIGFALWLAIGVDRLIIDLKQNKELRRALA
ncbi:MAG: hypothetical protein ABIV13_05545, partial [Fimbriimonadales bacterium]